MTGSSWSSRSMTCPRAPKARNGRPPNGLRKSSGSPAALAEMEGAEAEHEKMAEQIAEVSARVESAERDAEQKAREIETLNASLAAAEESGAEISGELAQCTAARQQCAAELAGALQQIFKPTAVVDGIVVTVPGDVLFDFDTTEVRADARQALGLAAVFCATTRSPTSPSRDTTDWVGSESYNDELSLARAEAVAAWLVGQAGIAADRVSSRGMGESRPVADETLPDGSDFPEGRQRNRRVEIRILK